MSSADNTLVLEILDTGSKQSPVVTTISIDQLMIETLILLAVRLKDTEHIPKLLS
jgi:hypothetical protein